MQESSGNEKFEGAEIQENLESEHFDIPETSDNENIPETQDNFA